MGEIEQLFGERATAPLIRRRWPELTDEDAAAAAADRDVLVVRIVARYGIAAEWAERQVSEWEAERSTSTERRGV
ncbi:MAG: CsbD family protein [Alphaproteobacteria bacterium]|jgi:hypothetical protein